MAEVDRTKSSGLWDTLVALFSWLSKDTWKQGLQRDNSKRSDMISDGYTVTSLSTALRDSTLSPIPISGQPEMVPESPSQKIQHSTSHKSSAEHSCQSPGLEHKSVRIKTKQQASKRYFPQSPVTSVSPTSTCHTLSPTTPFSDSTPNSPGGSRREVEEYRQSLDLSCQITLTNPSPIFEGTYSDVYKGNCQGREAGAFFMWLIDTYSI